MFLSVQAEHTRRTATVLRPRASTEVLNISRIAATQQAHSIGLARPFSGEPGRLFCSARGIRDASREAQRFERPRLQLAMPKHRGCVHAHTGRLTERKQICADAACALACRARHLCEQQRTSRCQLANKAARSAPRVRHHVVHIAAQRAGVAIRARPGGRAQGDCASSAEAGGGRSGAGYLRRLSRRRHAQMVRVTLILFVFARRISLRATPCLGAGFAIGTPGRRPMASIPARHRHRRTLLVPARSL